jgi:hypothetical protein
MTQMVTETDRAWLAGIIDGEGHLGLFTNQEKDGSTKIKPVVNFVNTDMAIVNKALSILNDYGCTPYIVKRTHKNTRHQDCVEVKASSTIQIEKWLNLVTPYLCGVKKQKAEILLRYIKRRMDKRIEVGRNDLAKYSKADWDDVHEFRSSTTTRETSIDDDIVSSHMKV